MSTILLGVNVDHVATLRQSRFTEYPDPVQAACEAIAGGADSITVHLREDRRHIQDADVALLKEKLTRPLNLEMAMTDEMIDFAIKTKPEFCCLVPERREELTTEGGLDVAGQLSRTSEACRQLNEAGIRTSLFIDAVPDQIQAASAAGAGVIEIHTGHYADANTKEKMQKELDIIIDAVKLAADIGLQINAGHGLNYHNVHTIAGIRQVQELNIGHSIIARSVFTGIKIAVNEMKQLMQETRK